MAYQSQREEIDFRKFVDYKDVSFLRQFTSNYAKMLPKKRTGISSSQQRKVTLAVKRARFMGLLPYIQS